MYRCQGEWGGEIFWSTWKQWLCCHVPLFLIKGTTSKRTAEAKGETKLFLSLYAKGIVGRGGRETLEGSMLESALAEKNAWPWKWWDKFYHLSHGRLLLLSWGRRASCHSYTIKRIIEKDWVKSSTFWIEKGMAGVDYACPINSAIESGGYMSSALWVLIGVQWLEMLLLLSLPGLYSHSSYHRALVLILIKVR